MSIAERVETRVLSFLRLVGLLSFYLVTASVIVVLFAMAEGSGPGRIDRDPAVSARDVLSAIPGTEAANDSLASGEGGGLSLPGVAAGVTIPAPLRTVLANDDASEVTVQDWLTRIPEPDRPSFIRELSTVVALAGEHAASWEWDDRQRYIESAMDQYAQMKFARMEAAQDRYTHRLNRMAQYRTSLGTLLTTGACLAAGLVLLAIERNTRALRHGGSR